jgi:hypothetical protein
VSARTKPRRERETCIGSGSPVPQRIRRVVKINEDLLYVTRYALMGLRFAAHQSMVQNLARKIEHPDYRITRMEPYRGNFSVR